MHGSYWQATVGGAAGTLHYLHLAGSTHLAARARDLGAELVHDLVRVRVGVRVRVRARARVRVRVRVRVRACA